MEVAHTDFTEITLGIRLGEISRPIWVAHEKYAIGRKDVPRVELVEVCPVMVRSTSETTATWVLPMLSYTTVARRDMAPVLASLGESGRHLFRQADRMHWEGKEVAQGLIRRCKSYEDIILDSRSDLKRACVKDKQVSGGLKQARRQRKRSVCEYGSRRHKLARQ